ncbi:MAG TPA: SIMPL domain-containing protein [Rhizomicrobium sp.]
MPFFRHALVLGFLLACLSPGTALADPASPRTITISGQGEAAGIPDMVRISAGVSVRARTAAEALRANSAQMARIFSALAAMGVPDRAIQTSQFSISPQYTDGNAGPQRLTGYEVTNQVTVTLNDVSKLGGTLDALVAAGANQMDGIEFSIRDSAALMTQARQAAAADAIAKAQIYAKAAGVTLGPILSISESGDEGPRPVGMMAMRANAPTPVAAGEQKLSAGVTIVWEIH